MRAIIVGGSIGGLFAANILERSGWDAVVLERSAEPLSARGAGVVTHPELFAVMAMAGVPREAVETAAVDWRMIFDASGGRAQVMSLPQHLVAWGEAHLRLEQARLTAQVVRGALVTGFEDDGRRVVAHIADGRSFQGDVLIGADGFRSTVRRFLLPEETLDYAGYVAWRGLVDEDDLTLSVDDLMASFSFDFPTGEQILGYPVAKARNNGAGIARLLNYVWYRPAEDLDVLQTMLTDDRGAVWPDGIPPTLLRAEVLAQARADAEALLSPPLAAAVLATRQPILQPIYDYAASRFAVGRAALIGDAASVARPHAGMGVTKAAGDAAALAKALADSPDDVPAALARYDVVRRPYGHALVRHAQALGCTIGSDKPAPPSALMRHLMGAIAVTPDLQPWLSEVG